MMEDWVAQADALLSEAKDAMPTDGVCDGAIAAAVALQGIGRAMLAIESRLARIDAVLITRRDGQPSFEWEDIEGYQPVTGVMPIDKALAYNDPVPLLKQHLARRERHEGRDAVIADLTVLVNATPPGSPAHDGGAEWLKRYQAGPSAEEL